jgi:hypothetical protein
MTLHTVDALRGYPFSPGAVQRATHSSAAKPTARAGGGV